MPRLFPTDYSEPIQQPSNIVEKTLSECRLARNGLGLPLSWTGKNAVVFKMTGRDGSDYAMKCFFSFDPCQAERYAKLTRYLEAKGCMRDGYFVDFRFYEKGIRVNGNVEPVLRMGWVEGQTLDAYVDRNHMDAKAMSDLSYKFLCMVRYLREQRISHGDLQHSNILVRKDSLVLVDYDCTHVPTMGEGKTDAESGHENFAHPFRRPGDFNGETDNFSSWVILVSLFAMVFDPSIWRLGMASINNDSLIFSIKDFKDPENSPMFATLLKSRAEELRNVGSLLMSFTAVPYEVPSIADFEIPVKTSDASWISEYLGNVATPGKSVLVHRTPESTLSQTSPQQPTSRDPDPNTAEEFLQRHFADWRFTPMERDVDAMKKDAADLVKRGDYLGALDQYRSVLVQKPDDVECLVAMARIFQNHCYDRDFAEECYLRALAIERYDPDLFFEYGMLLYTGRGEGHIVKATDQFKRAVELSNLIPPRVQLAKCYSLRGRKPEAKEVLEEALRIDPSNREALEYLEKVRGY